MTPGLPLLGLDRDTVALVLGSGQDGVAASLACAAGSVYVLAAGSETVTAALAGPDTKGLPNIRLVRASVFEPPFPAATFDLIVALGVLERVGGRLPVRDPRGVQLELLKTVARLLKPQGTLLIGAGNWLSWRWRQRRRARPDTAAEGRACSRTEAGYRKLLREGGFQSSAFYWADPGHDRPHDLVPLENALVAERLDTQRTEPWLAVRPGWRAALLGLAARVGLLRRFIPEFVILARKDDRAKIPGCWGRLRQSIPALAAVANPVCTLAAQPSGGKSVIRVFEARAGKPCCIVKAHTPASGAAMGPEREAEALRIVNEHLSRSGTGRYAAPLPAGTAQIGSIFYSAESVAPGVPLAEAIFRERGRGRLSVLDEHMPRGVEAATEFARLLRHDSRVAAADPSWWQAAATACPERPASREWLDRLMRTGEAAGWVQHGDYTIGNIWIQSREPRITVIDWEHMFRGGPPLYDVFSLLLSALPTIPVSSARAGSSREIWAARFGEAFFGAGAWTARFRTWLSGACEKLDLTSAEAWPMFLQSLAFRAHYFEVRGSGLADDHWRFLAIALERRENFLLGHGAGGGAGRGAGWHR